MFEWFLLGFALGLLVGVWLMHSEVQAMRDKVKDFDGFKRVIRG